MGQAHYKRRVGYFERRSGRLQKGQIGRCGNDRAVDVLFYRQKSLQLSKTALEACSARQRERKRTCLPLGVPQPYPRPPTPRIP